MEINYLTFALSFIIPLLIYLILKYQKSTLANEVVKSTLLMTAQLSISIFTLTFIFRYDYLIITALYLVIMILFSYRTLANRIDKSFKFKRETKITLAVASLTVLIYLLAILSFSVYSLQPRYIIPLFGMILGNTCTATILAANEINNIFTNNKLRIETLISLGVPTKKALNEEYKSFITIALTPTLASMLNIGFVSLPGMMTGQILAGEVPVNAVAYQIMIMIAILGSITLSILLLKYLVIKKSINSHNQLTTRL